MPKKKPPRPWEQPYEEVTIRVPRHPVVRSRWVDDRHLVVDFRGIRLPGKVGMTHNPGRRIYFYSAEDLQARIDGYFDSCNGPIFDKYGTLQRDKHGEILTGQVEPYTMSGFAYHMGITTGSILMYRDGDVDPILDELRCDTDDILTFSRALTRAKQRIEAYAEKRLYDRDGANGARHVLDCACGSKWVSSKELAEIQKIHAEIAMKREEFELKKKLLEDSGGDDELTINIVRGKRKDSTDTEGGDDE